MCDTKYLIFDLIFGTMYGTLKRIKHIQQLYFGIPISIQGVTKHMEVAWPTGLRPWNLSRSPRVQIPLWPLAGVVSR